MAISACASTQGAGGAATEQSPPTTVEPTVVSYPEYRDPLIWLNRGVFAFNDVLYRFLLIPASKGYRWVMPDPVETGVSNFFRNLKTPIYAVNYLLQAEPRPLGRTLARFGINTTVGLLGLFDPAKAWFGLDRAETGFGDTLASYGVGYGIYLVIPVLGPSDLRDGPSLVADSYLSPVPYLTDEPATTEVQAFDKFQEFAPGASRYETLREQNKDDPYLFFRNLHLQGAQRDTGH